MTAKLGDGIQPWLSPRCQGVVARPGVTLMASTGAWVRYTERDKGEWRRAWD